jgi:hypothetical protein
MRWLKVGCVTGQQTSSKKSSVQPSAHCRDQRSPGERLEALREPLIERGVP